MSNVQLNSNQTGGLWRVQNSPNNNQLAQAINQIRNSASSLDRGGTLGGETATQIVYKDYLDNPKITNNQIIQMVQLGNVSKITTDPNNAAKIRQEYPDYATSRNHQVAVDVMSILVGASPSERNTISQNNPGLGLTGSDSTPSFLYRADPNGSLARNTASHDASSTITDQLGISGVNKALWGFDSTTLSAVEVGIKSGVENVYDYLKSGYNLLKNFVTQNSFNLVENISSSSTDNGIDDILFGDNFLGDRTNGRAINNYLDGGAGNDVLIGGAGDDYLDGGAGNDILRGGTGNGYFDYSYDDHYYQDGNDYLDGGAGNDTLYGDAGDDYLNGGAGNDSLYGGGGNDYLDGGAGNDTLYGDAGDDYLNGGDGNDSLHDFIGNNYLDGGSGNDSIFAGTGDDYLDGGAGNDYLAGGTGNDIYIFNKGDGQDTISGITVTIRFGTGINPTDVTLTRDKYDLYLIYGATDKITLDHYWRRGANNQIGKVEFANGTTWDTAKLLTAPFMGTVNDESFFGTDGNDTFYGLAGNDGIYAGTGDDYLDGGAGNDYLAGGTGNDIYIFNQGDGQDTIFDYDTTSGNTDTIRFGTGINPTDVTLTRDQYHLYLSYGATDKITVVQHYWRGGANNQIKKVEFANGTTWDQAKLLTAPFMGTVNNDSFSGTDGNDTFYGLAGNDRILGKNGNDSLSGGTGNDSLDGGSGNDIYIFNKGDGQDTIYDYDTTSGNTDTIRFGTGINPTDVTLTRDQYHLYLSYGATDKITVQNWGIANYQIEKVEFANGTTWDVNKLASTVYTGTANDDTLSGADGDDIIYGLASNDYIYGGNGNDIIEGGVGNDALAGDSGNDIYIFNKGDGQDIIVDYDTTSGNTDTIRFGVGINPTDITLTKDQENLYLSLNGTTDKITVLGWFYDTGYRVEKIEFANNTTWQILDNANGLKMVSENQAPTNLILSNSNIAENQAIGTVIGNLSTTDPDTNNTFTYSLVSGTGSTDNGLFSISNNQLRANSSFDFETKNSYSIRVRTTDQGGLSFEKQLTIGVTNVNESPTNLILSNSNIAENQAIGTVIGNLSTTDPDANNTFTYSLVSGTGSTDNGLFSIRNNQLRANSSFNFETKNSYSIRVRTRDQNGLSFEKQLTIGITDVDNLRGRQRS